ncbi:hypothetical protein OIE43_07780 [Streptomyces pseudovenezuelae]|uniref:hypothetical protein n=1 Tax=Streptomyces pseudovenezuelae TaxID=67350 RepID=UPI002E30B4C2|nr:hypothetical protein [Streptomyces pseudovenezuelae]
MTQQELPPLPDAPPPAVPPVVPTTFPPQAALPGRRMNPLVAGMIGLVLGAGVVGGAWALTAAGSGAPETFTLEGTFELTDEVVSDGSDGCKGRYDSGYDDIAEGTSVTVYGADGEVVATGALGDSAEDEDGTSCTFAVAVDDVPKGEKFYKVEVSHRGTVQLSAEEAQDGALAVSLG